LHLSPPIDQPCLSAAFFEHFCPLRTLGVSPICLFSSVCLSFTILPLIKMNRYFYRVSQERPAGWECAEPALRA
ncbi:mCG140916, isoform CRA_a, partial [Mus musculus]